MNPRWVGPPQREKDILDAYSQNELAICGAAEKQMKRYIAERGILSSSASRRFALLRLNDIKTRDQIGRLLSFRFVEIIVDEGQDCGEEELTVLRFLRNNGVGVVMVADMDQSIYEFRRATPEAVRKFVSDLAPGLRLSGNFRSSSAICSINDSLRASEARDLACGPTAEEAAPIYLLPFASARETIANVMPLLQQHAIDSTSTMVLAHKTSDARKHAGVGSEVDSHLENKVLRMAVASATLLSRHATSRARKVAMATTERVLVDLIDLDEATSQLSVQQIEKALGLNSRWVRATAMRIVYGVSPNHDRKAYAAKLRDAVRTIAWPDGVHLGNLSKLVAPEEKYWKQIVREVQGPVLPWGTVHSAKGREFDAVVAIIPRTETNAVRKSGLELWEAREDGEARRVLYVAASRAKRLLILVAHASLVDRVQSILERDEVGFCRIDPIGGTRAR